MVMVLIEQYFNNFNWFGMGIKWFDLNVKRNFGVNACI